MNDYIDGYCERLEPGLWAEPVNALTNLAFIIAAIAAWRISPASAPLARALSVVLFAIGVGSGLFHTFATGWAAASDVLPIMAFVVLYIFVANRDYWGLRLWPTLALTLIEFVALAFVGVGLERLIPALGATSGYVPIAGLILIYGLLLLERLPQVGRGLVIGAAILGLSLTARWMDLPYCTAIPLGTHFAWHILNAVMLWWMIRVYVHHLANGREAR